MELTLNLAWMVLVTMMLWLWLCSTPREDESRWTQSVALAVVILILFPVISVTDDLMAAQNLAEISSCERKDHVCANPGAAHHVSPEPFMPVVVMLHAGSFPAAPQDNLLGPYANAPTVRPVQPRPPPALLLIYPAFTQCI